MIVVSFMTQSTLAPWNARTVTPKTTVIVLGDARSNNLDPRAARIARLAQRQRAGQVLLDGNRVAFLILRQVDDAEAAGRYLFYNAVPGYVQSFRQRGIVLRGHVFAVSLMCCADVAPVSYTVPPGDAAGKHGLCVEIPVL